jgi:hypothetical protein
MVKPTIKVGSYYEFTLSNSHKIAFSVLYSFERGKNKDVYTVMMYTDKKTFEFPLQKSLFDKWVDEGRIREITGDEALSYAL